MASDVDFVEYVCEQVRRAGNVTYRRMFGEFALYCDGKVVALVCDNQLFLKPTDAGKSLLGPVREAPPYPGARPYYLIDAQLDDADAAAALVRATADALPPPKPKSPRKTSKPAGGPGSGRSRGSTRPR